MDSQGGLPANVANAGVRIVPKNSVPIPITSSAIRLICFIILIYYVLLHKGIEALEYMVLVSNTKTGFSCEPSELHTSGVVLPGFAGSNDSSS